MKRILRYFGFISELELIRAVQNYDKIKTLKYNELSDKSLIDNDSSSFNKALEEGRQGIGAMDFVEKFLKGEKL